MPTKEKVNVNPVTAGKLVLIDNGVNPVILIGEEKRVIKLLARDFADIEENESVDESKDKAYANANLIVAAVNSCKSVNESDPMKVAAAIPELVEALRATSEALYVAHDVKEAQNICGDLVLTVLNKLKS